MEMDGREMNKGAGEKIWALGGGGGVRGRGDTQNPNIYNTGSKYIEYYVIILFVE
jgi:hypothetical protein